MKRASQNGGQKLKSERFFIMEIRKSAEDYLEAMLVMKEQHGENGYITMNRDGMITLTDKGMEIAEKIYTRHKVLTTFFESIGVDSETAREDACKIEHDISEATFAAIRKHSGI